MIEGPPDIRTLARTPHLLVACDYDGTLAPVVADLFLGGLEKVQAPLKAATLD